MLLTITPEYLLVYTEFERNEKRTPKSNAHIIISPKVYPRYKSFQYLG